MSRTITLLALVAVLAGADASPDHLRILAIGNSFSNNALHYLPDVVKAAGCELERVHLMVGGSPLELHWKRAEAALADPNDPAGAYGKLGSLPANLDKGPWDAVTIQQYSLISNDPATYHPYADKLVALIRERAPHARILIHQTWAYRVDDPRFGPDKELADADVMYSQVRAAYHSVADQLGLELIPTGDAFHLITSDPAWAFQPDPAWNPKTAVSPSLPDQSRSLHAGWSWTKSKDGTPALRFEGHHANRNGEYLGACVWFETLFRRSVVGNAFKPEGMTPDMQARLQTAAHQAVAELAAAPAPVAP